MQRRFHLTWRGLVTPPHRIAIPETTANRTALALTPLIIFDTVANCFSATQATIRNPNELELPQRQ